MALTIRPDAALREQLDAIARAQGQSVNQYLLSLVRSDVARRQRLASAVGLSWRASDAELADALGEALSAPLNDIEQAHLPAEPGAAVAYAVARAAHKRRNTRASKPAPSPSGKPAPSPGPKPPGQRASAAPAPGNDDAADEGPPPEGETERQELERLRRNKARQQRRDKKGDAPATRSAGPAKVAVSWKEYDALLALRAKRAGAPAPPKGASGACATVWVHATDAELAAVRGAK